MMHSSIISSEQILEFSHYRKKQYVLLPVHYLHVINLYLAFLMLGLQIQLKREQIQKILRGRNGTLKFINLYA